MKVVIAMDSFKGSMTSLEAGNAAKTGVLRAVPNAEVIVLPLADGGEGTVEALIAGLRGDRIEITVSNPLRRPTSCFYGVLPGNVAVMEMAQAAGLTKITESERNPLVTSTYGVGEMIVDAIRRGCRSFVIGIGGSATNDGGVGMLQALGYQFLDKMGQPVKDGAVGLSAIVAIQDDNVIPELEECQFHIACDVDNPLCGANGATFIYGPQKGLPLELCQSIDDGMANFASIAECFSKEQREVGIRHSTQKFWIDTTMKYSESPGAGAAGGLGFAFTAFLNGRLTSGVDLILDTIHIEEELECANIVITGEGRLDGQTARGKAPIGVAKRAKKYDCHVLAFVGCVGAGAKKCILEGIDAYYSIGEEGASLEDCMQPENAIVNLENKVEEVFRKEI